MKGKTMSNTINEENKGGKMMKKYTMIAMLPVLCLGLCLSAPQAAMAAGQRRVGTVVRAKPGVIKIVPPKTSASVVLEANDPAVTFENMWYCTDDGMYLKAEQTAMKFYLKNGNYDMVNSYIEILWAHRERMPTKFWYIHRLDAWNANPGKGKKISHSWKNCYTKQELAKAKREAIRWAKYMKNTWLPAHNEGWK